ncbi:MAG: helix-turn-helix transcriptional regulator [Planctomycetes bacterium]|nr:helix-turn-helix transcriptional regulator [Planctomycetota bacterium]
MSAPPVPFVQFAARSRCVAPWHWHNAEGVRDCANLWLIVGGRGAWRGEGRTFPCSSGDFFVQRLWKECEGTNVDRPPLDVLWANIGWRDHRGIALDLRARDAALPAVHRRVADLGFISSLFLRLIAASERGEPAHADRWLACVLDEAERTTDGDAAIARLVDAVRREPERPWRVSGLARSAGMAVDVFSRRFHAATGSSPRAFLVNARLEAAKAHLRMSDLSIGEIAARLGFCDIYHFSRRFRTHVGCAPTAYRAGAGSTIGP